MHSPSFYSAILLKLSILLIPFMELSEALAEKLPAALIDSIVLMRSKLNSVCATGFILSDGILVTNAHVSRALCPGGSCYGLQILRAREIGASAIDPISFTGATVVSEIPALDVSFLRLDGAKPTNGFFTKAKDIEIGGSVLSLGYPKCGVLTLSNGTVTQNDSLRFGSTVRSAHGSSGSPLFTPELKLVGVAQESDTLSGGFLSIISDHTFETIALRADLAMELRELPEDISLLRQVELLISSYRSNVRSLSGPLRLRAGISFFAAVEGIRDRILFSPRRELEVRAMAALGQYIDYIPRLLRHSGKSDLLERLENLVFAYNLELKGANQGFLIPARSDLLNEILQDNTVSKSQRSEIEELLSFAKRDNYQGLEIYGLTLAGIIIPIVILVVLILGWSMGYVYGAMPGSFFKRLLWTIGVLLIWPIPVITAWVQKRKHLAKQPASK